jgi:hypothetical protein
VIVSSNPLVRPNDYGIPLDAEHWDERTVRNVKMPWAEAKNSKNFLWEKGFQFYCLTPKSRHRVHSSWANVDWHLIWNSNFGDPYRIDKRLPNVGEHQMHMNPQAARDLGIADGDYVYVDANPADRPYSARPQAIRSTRSAGSCCGSCTTRVSLQRRDDEARLVHRDREEREGARRRGPTACRSPRKATGELPLRLAAVGHAQLAHADAPDRHPVPQIEGVHELPLRRRGGQPRRQHRAEGVLVIRITKAEDGGLGGKGVWKPHLNGMSPDAEGKPMKKYIAGEFTGKGEGGGGATFRVNPKLPKRMPKDEFDFEDPLELNGMAFLSHEDTTNDMAECFAEEFMRLGYSHRKCSRCSPTRITSARTWPSRNAASRSSATSSPSVFARWGNDVAPSRPFASGEENPAVQPSNRLALGDG